MQADLNTILPEIVISVYAMLALLGAVYTSKDKLAGLVTYATAGLLLLVAAWIGLNGAAPPLPLVACLSTTPLHALPR